MLSSAAKIIPYSNSFTLCSSTARKELLIMQPGCSLISMQPIKAGYTPNATNWCKKPWVHPAKQSAVTADATCSPAIMWRQSPYRLSRFLHEPDDIFRKLCRSRALSMKLSFLLCRLYPELLAEFSSALEMLDDTSPLTPALRVARKNILKKIHWKQIYTFIVLFLWMKRKILIFRQLVKCMLLWEL